MYSAVYTACAHTHTHTHTYTHTTGLICDIKMNLYSKRVVVIEVLNMAEYICLTEFRRMLSRKRYQWDWMMIAFHIASVKHRFCSDYKLSLSDLTKS